MQPEMGGKVREAYKWHFKSPLSKKPAQILFSKNCYGPKVKIEHWDFSVHAEPKDNNPYRDNLSNHISTYLRLGSHDHGTGVTETRVMQHDVFSKTDPIYSAKPLVNFTSYPCTDIPGISTNSSTPGRNRLMKVADLAQLPPDFGVSDFVTSHQDDYRHPHPEVMKPLTMESPPWLQNRVIRSDLTHNHGTAPPRGFYQCLDTHTPIGHIRKLKHFRYQSFDPATCLQTFPPPNYSDDKQITT